MNKQNHLNLETKYNKFEHPDITAKGETRASVPLIKPKTLWFNTGTLCNIECVNCYIESSPTNDRLVYISAKEVDDYLDQIEEQQWPIKEIGFTGGEPYMNPEMNKMTERALVRGYDVLVLTNAMKPMMRPHVQKGICDLINTYGDKLTFRVSLDHYSEKYHDEERGAGSFQSTIAGMRWLRDQDARLSVAGRSIWDNDDPTSRRGFAELFKHENFSIDANNPTETVLFPEMDDTVDVPEITTSCWSILNVSPRDIMCSNSRMVVKRKGEKPSVMACTLLPYSPEFNLGNSLKSAEKQVKFNHPHCAKFCVLGGASCSA